MAPEREYAPGDLIPGTIYRVVRKIGAGGMGAVYDVEDTSVGRRYVLKAMHPDLCERKDLTRRMQVEARTLGRLSHANIVEVVTAGATADEPPRPFFVMERLEGRSLRAVLDSKGRLSLHHAFAITLDLLAALEHAHHNDVIHRDVKPDNLFLHRPRGVTTTTKLLDFGIMRIARAESSETAGRFVGTLRYAAPEQLRGERATPETDLYAVGLVLFEMIAGRGPFDDAGDATQVASAHLKRAAPLLSTFRNVPRELDALVASALAKDPSSRPRDARSFANALHAIPAIEPDGPETDSEPDSPLPVREPPSQSRLIVIGAIAVIAALVAIVALTTGTWGGAKDASPPPPSATSRIPSGPAPSAEAPVLAPPLFDDLPPADQRDSRL